MSDARVEPLPEPWSDEDAAAIGRWGHPDRTYPPLQLTRTLQRHPKLADRLRALGESLYVDGRLPARDRTLAILRTCGLTRCAYEWGGQAAFWGPIAGVSPQECDALALGTDPEWSPREAALLAAVEEVEATGGWGDATWAALGASYDDDQRMELLVVVGWYRTICTLCNGLALPVEGWMRPWPTGA